jgi:hypothetical protein
MNSERKLPIVPRAVLLDLCRDVERMQRMQAEYFKSHGDKDQLAACRATEKRLAQRVKELKSDPDAQPTLWANDVEQVLGGLWQNILLDIAEKMRSLESSLAAGKGFDRQSIIRYLNGTRGRLLSLVPESKGGAA